MPIQLVLAAASLLASARPAPAAVLPPRPRLVLLLVIDQFRADYLLRFEKQFLPARGKDGSPGGFAYLMSQGAYFPMAEYGLLQSMTCPGHATLLTGAYPYQSGIPINFWYDAASGQPVYCAEDPDARTVGAPHRDHVGTSPRLLIASTVGDELKNAGLPSKVVTVALKDRSAIMMGGKRADLAFWMDTPAQTWASSTYYCPDGKLPDWLARLNEENRKLRQGKITWSPGKKASGLSDEAYQATDDTSHVGNSFPHVVDAASKPAVAMPFGLELTETAAERALDHYRLGQGPGPDILGVSFSSHDYIGHAFGPNSREMEEMTLHEDRLIARLLNHVRKKVPGGLKDVVVVLTGDHGGPPEPGWARSKRLDAGKMTIRWINETVESHLDGKFGKPDGEKWIDFNRSFDLFVNRKAVASRKAELPAVLAEIKARMLKVEGIEHVLTGQEHAERRLPPGLHGEQAMHSYYPGRSGDVVLVPRPNWMLDEGDAVTHLTGYSYDRMVPLIIAGPRVRPGLYPQHARVIDLAPTLSAMLGVLPPTMSEGRVLHEILPQPGARR